MASQVLQYLVSWNISEHLSCFPASGLFHFSHTYLSAGSRVGRPSLLMNQGFCSYAFLCLEYSSPSVHKTSSSISKALMKHHLLKDTFPNQLL